MSRQYEKCYLALCAIIALILLSSPVFSVEKVKLFPSTILRNESRYYPSSSPVKQDEYNRPNSCLALSGGGLRAAIVTLGFLKELSPYKLPRFDIISTVSGSSWTVAMLLGEAVSGGSEKSVPNLLARGEIGTIENGVEIVNFRVPKPYVIGTWLKNFSHSKAGFRDFLSGVGHSQFFDKVDFSKLDTTFDSMVRYQKLNFPYVIFGTTAVVAADATAEMPDVKVEEIRRKDIPRNHQLVTAEMTRSNREGKLVIQFRPVSLEYFDITPLFIGSPLHGYTVRPAEFTPLVTTAISSAGVDYIHPDGSLGIVDGPIVQLFDLATQYTYDDVEADLQKSDVWSLISNKYGDSNGIDSKTKDRVVSSDVDIVLSDGGHSDKLGIVPLLWRGCRKIVALDMGEDPNLTFSDEINLIRRVNADPYIAGVLDWKMPDLKDQIDSDGGPMWLSPSKDPCGTHALSKVKIIKLAFRGCESEGIDESEIKELNIQYLCRRYNGTLRGTFPHESVQILQYDKERVGAYEELGRWLAIKHAADVDSALRLQ